MFGLSAKTSITIFLTRLVITLVGVGATSFAVANYVVKANSTGIITAIETIQKSSETRDVNFATTLSSIKDSTNITLAGLQTSIDRLNETVIANNQTVFDNTDATMDLGTQLSSLSGETASQTVKIDDLDGKVTNLQTAVLSAGIPVLPTAFHPFSAITNAEWAVMRDGLRANSDGNVYIEAEGIPLLINAIEDSVKGSDLLNPTVSIPE